MAAGGRAEHSTAQIAGSTASIDPDLQRVLLRGKKGLPAAVERRACRWKPGRTTRRGLQGRDQFTSVRQNARRQRHVDQSISFNLYVPSTIRASTLLELHLSAWREG